MCQHHRAAALTVCVQMRRKEEVIVGEPGGAPGSTPKYTLFPPELPHTQQWSPAPQGTGHAVLSFLLRHTTLYLLLLRKGWRAHLSLLISPHLKLGLRPSFMLFCECDQYPGGNATRSKSAGTLETGNLKYSPKNCFGIVLTSLLNPQERRMGEGDVSH